MMLCPCRGKLKLLVVSLSFIILFTWVYLLVGNSESECRWPYHQIFRSLEKTSSMRCTPVCFSLLMKNLYRQRVFPLSSDDMGVETVSQSLIWGHVLKSSSDGSVMHTITVLIQTDLQSDQSKLIGIEARSISHMFCAISLSLSYFRIHTHATYTAHRLS